MNLGQGLAKFLQLSITIVYNYEFASSITQYVVCWEKIAINVNQFKDLLHDLSDHAMVKLFMLKVA